MLSCRLSQLKLLAILRHLNRPTKSIADMTGHGLRSIRLAVGDENAFRRGGHSFQPANCFFPIGVRRKAANLLDMATHVDPLTENFHSGLAVGHAAAERARR